jgi:para-aminobenzoate synthetase component 1
MLQKINLPQEYQDPWKLFLQLSSEFSEGFFFDAWGASKITYMGFEPKSSTAGEVAGPKEQNLQKVIDQYLKQSQSLGKPDKYPFEGGLVALLGYNCGAEFESFPNKKKHSDHREDFYIAQYETVIIFDPSTNEYFLAGEQSSCLQKLIKTKTQIIQHDISQIKSNDSGNAGNFNEITIKPFKTHTTPKSRAGEGVYSDWVNQTVEYIAAGDIFQANLAHPLEFNYEGSPFELYSRVREYNPSPYGGICYKKDLFLLSNSPELLFSNQDGRLVTRPIAGTRPRSESSDQDLANKEELFLSEKEQAEHIMLVDLERNDLGRVSQPGSVQVEELMECETYQNVFHIVSQVVGQLRKECDIIDVIKALFPGGTITGAPKIRSMEIIDELETSDRQFYTGSMGWIGPNGNSELNILIRSLILNPDENGGVGRLQVGAGIVADSDPQKEWEETLAKAAAWMKFLR